MTEEENSALRDRCSALEAEIRQGREARSKLEQMYSERKDILVIKDKQKYRPRKLTVKYSKLSINNGSTLDNIYLSILDRYLRFSANQMPHLLSQQVVFDFSLEYFIFYVLWPSSPLFPILFLPHRNLTISAFLKKVAKLISTFNNK